MDLTGVRVLKVAFRYLPSGMETGEAFVVEVWDGADWVAVSRLVAGQDFTNGAGDYGFVKVERGQLNFASDARVRIRCDATDDSDAIYLLDVGIYTRGE